MERQERVSAIAVPKGAPNTLATVMPAPIIAIAEVPLPDVARREAIIEPTPK